MLAAAAGGNELAVGTASTGAVSTGAASTGATVAARGAGDGSAADWEFHQSIFNSTGNPFFPQLIGSMRDLLHQLWENALELPDFAEASLPFHRTMYEAIRRRDPETARAEAWKLIDSVETEIREAFPYDS